MKWGIGGWKHPQIVPTSVTETQNPIRISGKYNCIVELMQILHLFTLFRNTRSCPCKSAVKAVRHTSPSWWDRRTVRPLRFCDMDNRADPDRDRPHRWPCFPGAEQRFVDYTWEWWSPALKWTHTMRETSFRQLRRRVKPPQEESGPGKPRSAPEILKGAAQVTGLRSAGAGWDEPTSEQAPFSSISVSPYPQRSGRIISFHKTTCRNLLFAGS